MDRKRNSLQTIVTEDHHQVLEHIYRAIGSKRLPFSGLTLLHWDSHPDLLIPIHMNADHVFLKEKLFESLSIENWIMPAVYAGHIEHVIWLKPPWSDQIEDKQIQFYVGKCTNTGCIRLASTENYFISESLYCPDHLLQEKKLLTLTIMTLQPQEWRSVGRGTGGRTANPGGMNAWHREFSSADQTCVSALNSIPPTQSKCGSNMEVKFECGIHNGKHRGTANPTHSLHSTRSAAALMTCDMLDVADKSVSAEEMSAGCDHASPVNCLKRSTQSQLTDPVEMGKLQSINKLKCDDVSDVPFKHRSLECKETDSSVIQGETCLVDSTDLTTSQLQQLQTALEGRQFVLDIDLDFFSTLNPFRLIFSEYQFSLLKSIYKFETPVSQDHKDIAECVSKRKVQLEQLKTMLQAAKALDMNTSIVGPERPMNQTIPYLKGVGNDADCLIYSELLELLLTDMKSESVRTGEDLDYDLIHEAGCTCDDTELPHHKSTDEQVLQLAKCMERLLRCLPPPSMITISRSSDDDYCPSDQVDFIEDLVLETLQNLYKNMNITKHYQ